MAAPRISNGSSSSSSTRQIPPRCCLHSSRPSADMPGRQHPAFKLSTSDFVSEHNQNNDKQRLRQDAPKALRAARALQAGDPLYEFQHGAVASAPSHWTLQVSRAARAVVGGVGALLTS